MKKSITYFILTLFSCTLFSQNDLGLTYNEIATKYVDCKAITNDSNLIDSSLLILNCEKLFHFYSFDGENKKCVFYGYEIPSSRLENFKSQIITRGYTLFASLDSYPIVLSLKGGNKNNSTPADIYENKKFVFSILKYDLSGDDSSRKIGVYVEYYKKEMFEK